MSPATPYRTTTPRSTARARRRGFTLIETMMALFAFAVILLGAVGVASFANNTAYSNAYKTVANQAAQGFIEQIRGAKYGTLLQLITPSSHTVPDSPDPILDGTPERIALTFHDPVTAAADSAYKSSVNRVPVYCVDANRQPVDRLGNPVQTAPTPVDGIYVTTTVVEGLTTNTSKMDYRLTILARRDPEYDGIAFDLVYTYKIPGSGGSWREITEVQTAYVANAAH